MVEKTQLHVRISVLHRSMLDELCQAWGLNEGEAVGILIDRAWRDRRQAQGLSLHLAPASERDRDNTASSAAAGD